MRASPLGLPSGTVLVVPYDTRWPGLFAAEAERIGAALHALGVPAPLRLEHTGSTSIPGLAAKPIIDILAGRPADVPAAAYVAALVRAGYEHRGEQGIPGREFFRRGAPRSYHLHLAETGGAFWQEHVRFRDALRGDDTLRDAYASLKHALAARFPFDRERYTDGKAAFVRDVLARSA